MSTGFSRGGEITHHSGVICKSDEGLKLFHFAWHELLFFEPGIPQNRSVYIGLEGYDNILDSRRVNTLSLIKTFKLIAEKNHKKIPYDLCMNNLNTFMDNYEFAPGEGSFGLTCSTFLMTFFKKYDLDLVDFESWQSRPEEDEEWKNYMIDFMIQQNLPKEHIERVKKSNVMFRFRPEEVVASGLKYPHELTAKFDFCVPEGGKIKTILQS